MFVECNVLDVYVFLTFKRERLGTSLQLIESDNGKNVKIPREYTLQCVYEKSGS